MQSDSVKELAAALAKAREKFAPVKKTKEVRVPGRPPYFYAPLDAVYDATLPALGTVGIVVIHQTEWQESVLMLKTKLLHTSGEWIEASMPIPSGKMQEMGSALTYGKRYQVSGLLAIAAEDDDDATAADAKASKPTADKPKARKPPEPPASHGSPAGEYFAATKARDMTLEEAKALMWDVTGAERSADVPADKWPALMEAVQKWERQ